MTTGYQTGLRAEKIAALYLRCKGFKIISHRYKTPVGEIDLIARRGRAIVFVEVKSRQTLDQSLYAVQPHQAARIRRAAEYFMMSQDHSRTSFRFDVIAMAKLWQIRHVKNVF